MELVRRLLWLSLLASCAPPITSLPGQCEGRPLPTANAGPDRSVKRFEDFPLMGSGSGAPGVPLTYQWQIIQPDGVPYTPKNGFSATAIGHVTQVGENIAELTVKDGCFEVKDTAVLTGTNDAPVAAATTTSPSLLKKTLIVTVDGSGSSDPDRDLLTYSWVLEQRPIDSTVTLTNPTSRQASFLPDVEGDYQVSLKVNDGFLDSAKAFVTVTATNRPPTADAGVSAVATEGGTATLSGTGADPDGDAITWQWTIADKPAGSAASLSDAQTPRPTLLADREGTYTLSLQVSDRTATSAPSTTTVTAYRKIQPLGYAPIDAEYSNTLDRLVMVSANPNALHIYDPATATEVAVPLSVAPTSLSLSPDGGMAAVGHNAFISEVNLNTAQVVGAPIAVPIDVYDLALSGTRIHAFPRGGGTSRLQTVLLSTRAVTTSTSNVFYDFKVRLHPSGTALYAADVGISPADLFKHPIATNGTAQVGYDSQYHGDYPIGGELWLSPTGDRALTAGGTVFALTPTATSSPADLTYAGALEGFGGNTNQYVEWLSLNAPSNEIAVIPSTFFGPVDDRQLRLHAADFYALRSVVQLTRFVVAGRAHDAHGRFVFHRANGSARYVVVQADPSAQLTNRFGVVLY